MRAALELFEERGYDSTTTVAIAQLAGVSDMTFYRHFASKDAVLLADPYDPLIADAIRRQPAALAPVAAAIHGIAEAWTSVPAPETSDVRRRLRVVSGTLSLRGPLARNSAATELAIANALSGRGVSPGDARIAASATIGALNAALLDWADGEDPDLGNAIAAALRVLTGARP
jgi:AcrR family transcriptional regulator